MGTEPLLKVPAPTPVARGPVWASRLGTLRAGGRPYRALAGRAVNKLRSIVEAARTLRSELG